ncbi:hypothetical protein ACN1YD_001952 [Vibrio cholerae]
MERAAGAVVFAFLLQFYACVNNVDNIESSKEVINKTAGDVSCHKSLHAPKDRVKYKQAVRSKGLHGLL